MFCFVRRLHVLHFFDRYFHVFEKDLLAGSICNLPLCHLFDSLLFHNLVRLFGFFAAQYLPKVARHVGDADDRAQLLKLFQIFIVLEFNAPGELFVHFQLGDQGFDHFFMLILQLLLDHTHLFLVSCVDCIVLFFQRLILVLIKGFLLAGVVQVKHDLLRCVAFQVELEVVIYSLKLFLQRSILLFELLVFGQKIGIE